MPSTTVLILGGTFEARTLAARMVARGAAVVSSLAGRVAEPALPAGRVRIGGFGGPEGLAEYLRLERIGSVVDATHPFATAISASAATACGATGVPLLRLARPGWAQHPDAGTWEWVESFSDAAVTVPRLGNRVFLTTGRTTLRFFTALPSPYVLVRLVDSAPADLPPEWEVIRSRGPYTIVGERDLLDSRGIDVLVTKDSGGGLTSAKLTAATAVGARVVVVRRPASGTGVERIESVEGALDWLKRIPAASS